jgi:Protein of unknown function (DUF2510)
MRFPGRRTHDGKQHGEPLARGSGGERGAWYVDPYETASERWWDGQGWTQEVRGTPNGGSARTRSPNVRSFGRHQAEVTGPQPDQSSDFPVAIAGVVGEKLRVLATDPELSARDRRELGLSRGQWVGMGIASVARHSYDVLAAGGRVGALEFGGEAGLARIACAAGAWCLKKRRPLGWELIIESTEGRHVGWYSGRRWLPGGTIYLTDDTQVALRRSLKGGWELRTTNTRQRFAHIRASHRRSMALTIESLPSGITADLVVLTACAVVILEAALPPVLQPTGVS